MSTINPGWFGSAATLAAKITPTAAVTAGLLVGFGTRLGSGCTSGHGVCGLPRRSLRSLTAVGTFFSSAVITACFTRNQYRSAIFTSAATITDATAATSLPYLAPTLGLLAASFVLFHIGSLHKLLTGTSSIPQAEEPCLEPAPSDEEPVPSPSAAATSSPDSSDKNSDDGSDDSSERSPSLPQQQKRQQQRSKKARSSSVIGSIFDSVANEIVTALEPRALLSCASAYVSALLFGVGLSISGMTNPEKVRLTF